MRGGISVSVTYRLRKVECFSQLKVRKFTGVQTQGHQAPGLRCLPLSTGIHRGLPVTLLAPARGFWSFEAQLGYFPVLPTQVSKGWRAAGMGGLPWKENERNTQHPHIGGPRRSWFAPAVTAATCLGHQGEVPVVQVRSHSLLRVKAAHTVPACPQGRNKRFCVQGSHPGLIRRACPFLRAWKETATHH